MIFLRLLYEFFKVGLFAFGGGLATLPFLNQLAEKTGWFTTSDLANMLAVSESTPGAIGVNMSTYVGYMTVFNQTGNYFLAFLGGCVATLGLVAPSIIVILIICKILDKFRDNKFVNYAFYGLRAASFGLICAACYSVFEIAIINIDSFKQTNNFFDLFNLKQLILLPILIFLVFKFKKHPILYIFIAAVIGIVFEFSITGFTYFG